MSKTWTGEDLDALTRSVGASGHDEAVVALRQIREVIAQASGRLVTARAACDRSDDVTAVWAHISNALRHTDAAHDAVTVAARALRARSDGGEQR